MAKRYQLSRKRGAKLPDGVVNCARPGKYGNMWKVGDKILPRGEWRLTREEAVELFRGDLQEDLSNNGPWVERLRFLRGKDLACWCPLDAACHVDVLLELANAEDVP